MTHALTRRDRLRAATAQEIKDTARRLLVEHGPGALTLRAIAREMGMTAPGLYRYFDSYQVLIRYLVADVFDELADALQSATGTAGQPGDQPGRDGDAELAAAMFAACREFRRWALDHPAEYALVFGTPVAGVCDEPDEITGEAGRRFTGVFFALFVRLWLRRPFPVPADEEIDSGLRGQLARFGADIATPGSPALPLGALLAFVRCWVRLYGAVTLEAFGHMKFALDDAAAMFEYTLADLAAELGVPHQPPAGQGPRGPGGPGPAS